MKGVVSGSGCASCASCFYRPINNLIFHSLRDAILTELGYSREHSFRWHRWHRGAV